MSTEAFEREVTQTVLEWVEDTYPGMAVVVGNGPNLDRSTTQEFLDLEFRYYGATDATVGVRPILRDTGAVSIRHYAREQTGEGRTRQVLAGLRDRLRARQIAGGVIRAPQLTVPTSIKGWYSRGILAPFSVDTQ